MSVSSAADEDSPYNVVSLDPGGTTGWAVFSVHPEAMSGDPDIKILPNILFWAAGQFSGLRNSQVDEIRDLIAEWHDARLVSESFRVRQLNAVLEPDRINAILEYVLRPRYLVYQEPGLAMSTVTDDRQKDWGFWVPGQEHARDAIKHNITFLRRMKERAVRAERVSSSSRSE